MRYPASLLEQLKWTWGTNRKKCTVGKSPVTLMNVVLWVLGNALWWDAGCAPAHKVVSTAKSDDVRVWELEHQGHRRRMDESREQRLKRSMPSHLDIRHEKKKKTVTSGAFSLDRSISSVSPSLNSILHPFERVFGWVNKSTFGTLVCSDCGTFQPLMLMLSGYKWNNKQKISYLNSAVWLHSQMTSCSSLNYFIVLPFRVCAGKSIV